MTKMYAVFEGNKIIRKAWDKKELINYRNSFSEEERKGMIMAEKLILGPREWEQSHWLFKGGDLK